MKYTYNCILTNKKEVEENFTVDIVAPSQSVAKDRIERMLEKEYGRITMRIYQSERMISDRYWDLILEHIEMPAEEDNSITNSRIKTE